MFRKTAQWFFFVSLRDFEKYSSCLTFYPEFICFFDLSILRLIAKKLRLICVYIEGRTILHYNAKNIGVNRNNELASVEKKLKTQILHVQYFYQKFYI